MRHWSPVGAVLCLLAVLFFACTSSQMVETRGESPYAPAGERPGGRVQYLAEGASGVIRARREDAYKKMSKHCSGHYEIAREWDEAGPSYATTYGSGQATTYGSGQTNSYGWNANATTSAYGSASTVSGTTKLRNIDFVCTPKPRRTARGGASKPRAADSVNEHQGVSTADVIRDSQRELKLREVLALETGCPLERVTTAMAIGEALRLDACGRAYICRGGPEPSCRPALEAQAQPTDGVVVDAGVAETPTSESPASSVPVQSRPPRQPLRPQATAP